VEGCMRTGVGVELGVVEVRDNVLDLLHRSVPVARHGLAILVMLIGNCSCRSKNDIGLVITF